MPNALWYKDVFANTWVHVPVTDLGWTPGDVFGWVSILRNQRLPFIIEW